MDLFLGSKSVSDDKDKVRDEFNDRWARAREYWVSKHKIFDRNYLFYKSMSAVAEAEGGFSFARYFGTQIHVPRTFQTVESLYAQIANREMEFNNRGMDFESSEKEKFIERMDNSEFARSGAREEVLKAFHSSLIFGNGAILNTFALDQKKVHVPEIKNSVEEDGKIKTEINWKETWMVKYKGVKPQHLNIYNVFPDPDATNQEDLKDVFVYSTKHVDELREFVVASGWMSEEEALKKIQAGGVEHFDAVRDRTDIVYSGTGNFSISTSAGSTESLKDDADLCGIVERFAGDCYEMRLLNSGEALYKDYNIYLHKQIPIIFFHDYKLPDEFLALGEPEVIRWQVIEEDKIHNLVLYGTLMSVVQRYAVNSSLLEDPSDAGFYDPFRPIRVKAGLGGSVLNAVQPMPQPDVKQSPFKLMELVKEISQQTTGATDMLVSGNSSQADTATESNNLLAATAQRVRSKVRNLEVSLSKLVKQWHTSYLQFYDEELDLKLGNEKQAYFKFIPFARSEANENQTLVQEAQNKLNSMGDTLEEVYRNKGYKVVVFLSDLDGTWDVETTVKDSTMFFNQTLDTYTKIITALGQVNNLEQTSGGMRKFDVFKLAEDMMRECPMVMDVKKYVSENKPPQPAPSAPTPPQGVPPMPSAPMMEGGEV
jgi:hypothetical protein